LINGIFPFYFCIFQFDALGQTLLEIVYARLNLIETSYFGLRFLDQEGQRVSFSFSKLSKFKIGPRSFFPPKFLLYFGNELLAGKNLLYKKVIRFK
jgi:hypothetical protein